MKKISCLVLLCFIADIILLNNSIHHKVDVFAPGLLVLLLILLTIYTFGVAVLINRYALLARKPLLSGLLLAPAVLYVVAHVLILIINIIGLVADLFK